MGHVLKPVVLIGQQGLSEALLAELASSLNKHELLKLKIRTQNREQKQHTIDEIIKLTEAHLVQVIGNVLVIYRAFDEEPQLILPRR